MTKSDYLARVEVRAKDTINGYYKASNFQVFSIVPQVGQKLYLDSRKECDYLLECMGFEPKSWYLPVFIVEEIIVNCHPIIINPERTIYLDFLVRCLFNKVSISE